MTNAAIRAKISRFWAINSPDKCSPSIHVAGKFVTIFSRNSEITTVCSVEDILAAIESNDINYKRAEINKRGEVIFSSF